MKKPILITLGILLPLIVGVWFYLFMYGTPKSSDEVFARFGIGEDSGEVILDPAAIENEEDAFVDDTLQNPRQLTTRPAVGATFTGTGILYAEQGTGHLYHINLTTRTETLVSGTTILGVYDAQFSEGGAYVALTAREGGTSVTYVGSVTLEGGTGEFDAVTLPTGAREVSLTSALGTAFYTLSTEGGTSGYSYSIEKETGVQVFSIPLRDVHVLWGSPLYVYTTPSATQVGYLYKVFKNELSYVTEGGLGLTGILHEKNLIVTKSEGETVSSYIVDNRGEKEVLQLPLIPEKCTRGGTQLFCAVPNSFESSSFPDAWYKGVVSFSDSLWNISLTDGENLYLSDFLGESGREIDVSRIGTNPTGESVYFINKNDNALWMFDARTEVGF